MVKKRGLLLFLIIPLAWLAFAALARLELILWGAAAGLAVTAALLVALPRGRRWNVFIVFSLLYFLVATAAVAVMGESLRTRVPNLLAGGFATLSIMAGYGALEGILFPAQLLELGYPESKRESPIIRRVFWAITLVWDAIFLAGLAVNLICMLALRGRTSFDVSTLASLALLGTGAIITPVLSQLLPRRMEHKLVEKGPLSAGWKPPLLTPGTSHAANEYDVVVVGSGMGGLACASLLAQAGMKVLVTEKARLPGGYSQTYDWQGFPLNSGPTILLGGTEGGVLHALLARLGLLQDITFRRLTWGLVDGDMALRLGLGAEQDVEKMARKFPRSRAGLEKLLSDLRRFRGEYRDRGDFLSSPLPASIQDYHEQFLRHPLSARWQNLGFEAMLEEYGLEPRLVRILSGLSALLGGEPSTFPAYEGARLLTALLIDGIHYPEGHISTLVSRIVERIRSAGGEIMTSCGAEQILVRGEGSRATPIGIRLSDGSQVRCGVVVLDADPRRLASGLLPPSLLGGDFLRELEKLKPSCSAFVLHLLFEEDLRLPDRVFLFPAQTRRVRTGDTFLEADCLLLAKDGHSRPDGNGCVLMVRLNVPTRCYPAFEGEEENPELGPELTALIKEEVASVLPATKRSEREFTTLPTHLARLTSHGQGAAFGFAPHVDQWYFRRPGPRLPLPNLYLVGAWSRYGGGVEGAALSGAVVARELCGESPYGLPTGGTPVREMREKTSRRKGRKEPSPAPASGDSFEARGLGDETALSRRGRSPRGKGCRRKRGGVEHEGN